MSLIVAHAFNGTVLPTELKKYTNIDIGGIGPINVVKLFIDNNNKNLKDLQSATDVLLKDGYQIIYKIGDVAGYLKRNVPYYNTDRIVFQKK